MSEQPERSPGPTSEQAAAPASSQPAEQQVTPTESTATAISTQDAGANQLGQESTAPTTAASTEPISAAPSQPETIVSTDVSPSSAPKSAGGTAPGSSALAETSKPKSGGVHAAESSAGKKRSEGASPASPSPQANSSHRRKRQKLGELDLSQARIGFLGAGKMTESTINGLIHYGEYLLSSILLLLTNCQESGDSIK